jgi:hypothetical protein
MVFNKYILPFKQILSFLRGIIDPATTPTITYYISHCITCHHDVLNITNAHVFSEHLCLFFSMMVDWLSLTNTFYLSLQILSFPRGIIDPAIVLCMFMLALHFVIVCGMLEWKSDSKYYTDSFSLQHNFRPPLLVLGYPTAIYTITSHIISSTTIVTFWDLFFPQNFYFFSCINCFTYILNLHITYQSIYILNVNNWRWKHVVVKVLWTNKNVSRSVSTCLWARLPSLASQK